VRLTRILLGVCWLAIVVSPLLHPAGARAEDATRQAPSFAIRTLDGKTFRMSSKLRGPVVLDFWATYCAPCRVSMPHLSRIQERYAGEGLVVLGLSVDELEPAEVRKFVEQLRVRFRIAMADEKILDEYGPIRLLPTTFFINRQGEVVRRTVGYIDEETLDSYVRELF